MTRVDLPLEPELESLVRPPKIVRQAPDALRSRALARARAIAAAGGVKPPAWAADPPALVSVSPSSSSQTRASARGRAPVRIAFAAAVAVVAIAVGAIASLRARDAERTIVAPEAAAPPARSELPLTTAEAPPPAAAAPAVPRPQRVLPVRSRRSLRLATTGDPSNAELELLQRAQAAYTRHDYSSALALLVQHARTFPRGHLAEERDALRVRCLLGSGRAGEAHRAAKAFGARFPRSVLLPRVDSAESD
ncbi:MAG TPA: hypothetical protein VLT58_08955 [Polyangia bacterium]|nr:hypothetical protein [Polyangia bacterium]